MGTSSRPDVWQPVKFGRVEASEPYVLPGNAYAIAVDDKGLANKFGRALSNKDTMKSEPYSNDHDDDQDLHQSLRVYHFLKRLIYENVAEAGIPQDR